MKSSKISDALNELDDELIMMTDEFRSQRKKGRIMKKILIISAAAAVILAGILVIYHRNHTTASDGSSDAANSQQDKTSTTPDSVEPDGSYPVIRILMDVPPKSDVCTKGMLNSQARITKAINKLVRGTLGIEVELELVGSDVYSGKLSEGLKNGGFDLVMGYSSTFADYGKEGLVQDLTQYLQQYGINLVESYCFPEVLTATYVDGQCYYIPCHKLIAASPAVFFSTDLLEKYEIDASDIRTLDDIDALFEKVSLYEPDLYITEIEENSLFNPIEPYDDLGTSWRLGMLIGDIEKDTTVQSWFETNEYQEWIRYAYTWDQKGYVHMKKQGDSYRELFRRGKLLCTFLSYYNTTNKASLEKVCQTRLTAVTLGTPLCTRKNLNGYAWAVPSGALHPEEAVKFMNLLSISADLENLLCWGEENFDYVIGEDGRLSYPEGVPAWGSTELWHYGKDEQLLNQELLIPWNTREPDYYSNISWINASAVKSPLIGFYFDAALVGQEIFECNKVINEALEEWRYHIPDPDTEIMNLVSKLYGNGLESILKEMQRQVDEYCKKDD